MRLLDAICGLFFLVLSALLILLATRFEIHDGNYAAFYVGLGVLLESLYLTVHFALKAILSSSRARLAERISRILGLLLLVPLGLIILILAVLIEQSIRSTEGGRSVDFTFASLVLFLLVAPGFLIFREIVLSFLRDRAKLGSRV
jgi:hypothetical protein